MPEYIIAGIPVNFPFEPYDVQKNYMTKVIECLESSSHGVLESPTGTGKTLSLLCSTLSWILVQKARAQAQAQSAQSNKKEKPITVDDELNFLGQNNGTKSASSWSVPKVIYSSRTHSQLIQAMSELKRTSYSYMRAVVLGSRDQLCIHDEVSKEQSNSMKIQMCKLRILLRNCSFYNRVEIVKEDPKLSTQSIVDIEDLIKFGKKLHVCPYFLSKELTEGADIIFMPYNYLIDPKARKAHGINLENTIIILDEAHNIEKVCEESASVQIKSSDIALAINDVTQAMVEFTEDNQHDSDEPKDFTIDDLALLKEMLLDIEKAIDEIEIFNKTEGKTYSPQFVFDILKKGNIHTGNYAVISKLLENLMQYLALSNNKNNSAFRKGIGLEKFAEFLTIVFIGDSESNKEKILQAFKVHIEMEEVKIQKSSKKDGWISTKGGNTVRKEAKIINYWCFNPGFGMEQLSNKNVRSIILTSGTLAPLKPLIAELAIPVAQQLENPHIVDKSQVHVRIIPFGSDREPLNSSFKNRDNPNYITSLGRTISSLCPVIPGGLLVFFPSYPLMSTCRDKWQASGIWSQINEKKQIFVEPRDKDSFTTAMTEYYAKIKDPTLKGACFMAVCRGKVSEGLDFADLNGRAVIITGLPYPPLKDPRIVLKRQYLDKNRTKENELISGDNWYTLEATRAVNQAIGRVIRHKNDYGAILLCDSRFNFPNLRTQLSSWIQEHMKNSKPYTNFGGVIGEIAKFFRNAEKTVPKPFIRELNESAVILQTDVKIEHDEKVFPNKLVMKIEKSNAVNEWSASEYREAVGNDKNKVPSAKDFISRLNESVTTINFNESTKNYDEPSSSSSLVTVYKRERKLSPINSSNTRNKKKLRMINNPDLTLCSVNATECCSSTIQQNNQSTIEVVNDDTISLDRRELLQLIKNSLSTDFYKVFIKAVMTYQDKNDYKKFIEVLVHVFNQPCLRYLLKMMRRFIKTNHKQYFDEYLNDHLKNVE